MYIQDETGTHLGGGGGGFPVPPSHCSVSPCSCIVVYIIFMYASCVSLLFLHSVISWNWVSLLKARKMVV